MKKILSFKLLLDIKAVSDALNDANPQCGNYVLDALEAKIHLRNILYGRQVGHCSRMPIVPAMSIEHASKLISTRAVLLEYQLEKSLSNVYKPQYAGSAIDLIYMALFGFNHFPEDALEIFDSLDEARVQVGLDCKKDVFEFKPGCAKRVDILGDSILHGKMQFECHLSFNDVKSLLRRVS